MMHHKHQGNLLAIVAANVDAARVVEIPAVIIICTLIFRGSL